MKHTVDRTVPAGLTNEQRQWALRQAEQTALCALVDEFATRMKTKLLHKLHEQGYGGWDSPEWTPEQIIACLRAHVDKGDMVDVANFAAFFWNKAQPTRT